MPKVGAKEDLMKKMEKPMLFTVGPVWVRKDVRESMANQMFSHRSEKYSQFHERLVGKLKAFMGTKNDVFIYTSSSTGVMESVGRNCVDTGETVLTFGCGNFGEKFGKIIEENGKKVEYSLAEWGEANTAEQVDAALAESDAELVTLVHNETSTGVTSPLKDIAKVVKEYGVLFAVDTVSSMGGVDINVDELGIDVCFFGVQKCMAVPPGLAIASVSKSALEKAATVKNRGHYFDFITLKKFSDKNNTPYTPPIPQMFALDKTMDIIAEEGAENRFRRHKMVAETVRRRVKEMGFNVFPNEKYASNTLTCVDTNGRPLKPMLSEIKNKGYILASGYGKLKENTFRIGHMGNVTLNDVNEMLDALEEIVKK